PTWAALLKTPGFDQLLGAKHSLKPPPPPPVVSAYFDHSKPIAPLYEEFTIWRRSIRQSFVGRAKLDFDAATDRIQAELISRANKGTKVRSSAIFSRSGEHPFFLPLTFKVPVETLFNSRTYPVIFPRVELKDRFNRFVVILITQESARIIEMNLGETSLETLAQRPAARDRNGREWTREHYLNHGRERDRRFLKENVAMIEQLMSQPGIPIETARNSNLLIEQGGVGALLRYRTHPSQPGDDELAA
ncbi:MAG: hypothetical protein QNL33_09590, partial [Akkermansiaceae bacterium]